MKTDSFRQTEGGSRAVRLALVMVLLGFVVGGLRADLWDLGRQRAGIHRFSTLFTAQDVRDRLGDEAGLASAVKWCRETAVTKVYVESFRDGYQADRERLAQVRDRFRKEGIEVSGCVTPTVVGKSSTGWKNTISCYTDLPTQQRLQAIFEFTAGLFDEIMIDDFWFTDCACGECEAARQAKQVRVGEERFAVNGDSWEAYRCELMVRLSQVCVLAAAKKVNPSTRLIIKYPQWYDNFHERGYEVARETADFDRIWVGTETRDYRDPRWGGTVQYEAYFIMRWLGGIGGDKCGGGWYDWLGTTQQTYVEQARMTILGGARESFLFCYGGLQGDTGPKNVTALRGNLPELLDVAAQVSRRKPAGIAAWKPINSHGEKEKRVFDFVGMMGLPLLPTHEFPSEAPAAFFSHHALKDPDFAAKLKAFMASGRPVLLTDGLVKAMGASVEINRPNVRVLPVGGDPKSLLNLSAEQLDGYRAPLLSALGKAFQAPNRVALFCFADGSWVIENFNDEPADVSLDGRGFTVPARQWVYSWR
jgi:hypothetical protein